MQDASLASSRTDNSTKGDAKETRAEASDSRSIAAIKSRDASGFGRIEPRRHLGQHQR